MADPFEVAIHARWPDMDQAGHMRTVAYLEVAEDSRMQYFARYSMGSFVKHRIGPVVSRDELQYRAEPR
jgi:acyl-CoA thioesterase FadM